MPEELPPLSYNDFCELYENQIQGNDYYAVFAVYSMGYWLQCNRDQEGQKHYDNIRNRYENDYRDMRRMYEGPRM